MARPDLDDYRTLASWLPTGGAGLLYLLLRTSHTYRGDPWGVVFWVGLGMGAGMVAVLAALLWLWAPLVAHAVVEVGNPRLPPAFAIAAGLYLVVVAVGMLWAVRWEAIAGPLAFGAGALLPGVLLHWPMAVIKRRCDELYAERRQRRRK